MITTPTNGILDDPNNTTGNHEADEDIFPTRFQTRRSRLQRALREGSMPPIPFAPVTTRSYLFC
jgi:hypothetical protein